MSGLLADLDQGKYASCNLDNKGWDSRQTGVGNQGNRVLDSDYRWQTSARHKASRPELADGPEILRVSPVAGPHVGLWDEV